MSWFSLTDDYSIGNNDRDFYGDPEITYGPSEEGSSSSVSTSGGGWDDYQREREYISCSDQHTR